MKLQTALSFAAVAHLTTGCLLPEELEGKPVGVLPRQARKNWAPIGEGDRFKGGSEAPRGIGSNPRGFEDDSQLSLLSLSEIESALNGLKNAYPEKFTLTTADDKTEGSRNIYYGVVGSNPPRVFLTSGVHPRERGGPDNIIYLMSDLLWADKQNTGLKYGTKEYDVSQVRKALGAGIAIIPAVNPDGIDHDQTTDTCWRKNRRAFEGNQFGVDINRNFNVFWDYERIFSPQAGRRRNGVSMSKDPARETYIGPSPFSEPETRSINNVFEREKSLSWYLDLHSVSGQVLYSWGDDYAQSTNPEMSFRNEEFDRQRGIKEDEYKEFMESEDFEAQKTIATRMAAAMNEVANTNQYRADETMELYPALGSTDEAMSKYYNRTCGANRINALTFEFGQKKPFDGNCQAYFYPDAKQYRDNIVHTNVGLMEFLLNAAEKDVSKTWTEGCEASQQQSPPKPEQETPNKAASLTPEQQKCVDKYLPEYKKCTDAACGDKIKDETLECMNQPQQPSPPKPEQETPNKAASLTPEQQKCVDKYLPEYKKCTDAACGDKIKGETLECMNQSQQPSPPKPEQETPNKSTTTNLTPEQQKCVDKYLPEIKKCTDAACWNKLKDEAMECMKKPQQPAEPAQPAPPTPSKQPQTAEECGQAYFSKWEECGQDWTCKDNVRNEILKCRQSVAEGAQPEQPAEPAKPAPPAPKQPQTARECEEFYAPEWQNCGRDSACKDSVIAKLRDCREQVGGAR